VLFRSKKTTEETERFGCGDCDLRIEKARFVFQQMQEIAGEI